MPQWRLGLSLLELELRKSWRAPILLMVIGFVFLQLLFAFSLLQGLSDDLEQYRKIQKTGIPVPTCEQLNLPPGVICQQAQDQFRQMKPQIDQQFTQTLVPPIVARMALLQPVQTGIWAAGWLSSGPGLLFLLALGAELMGSEWQWRTVRTVLGIGARRWQWLASKVTVAVLISWVMLVVDWACLALASIGFSLYYRIEPIPGLPVLPRSLAIDQMARALVVVAFFAVAGVTAAAFARSPGSGLALGLVTLMAWLMLGRTKTMLGALSFATWVGQWMGWRRGQTWEMAHLFWIVPRHWLPAPAWAGAAIVLTLLAGVGLARVALTRDELA